MRVLFGAGKSSHSLPNQAFAIVAFQDFGSNGVAHPGGARGIMRGGRGAVPAVLLALVVLFVSDQGQAYSAGSSRQRVAVADWRLAATVDRFSGERRCRLATRRGSVLYSRGVVIIRLSRLSDFTEAVIRVDGSAPIRWRNLIPELARLDPGFAIDRDPGIMPVPAQLLNGAALIEVSPAFGKRARAFRVAGLDEALEHAATLGCRSDAAFVR